MKSFLIDTLSYLSFSMVAGFLFDTLAGIEPAVAVRIALVYAPLDLALGGLYGRLRLFLRKKFGAEAQSGPWQKQLRILAAEGLSAVLMKTSVYLIVSIGIFAQPLELASKSVLIAAVLLLPTARLLGIWMDFWRKR